MTINIVLAGARSVRQGTGPFIAAALHKAGARITGIVGTTPASVQQAEHELAQRHGITARGYTDLATAIATEQPDVVAICTPWQVHAEQLAIVAAAGCHCLVEKPLAWPLSNAQVADLVGAFEQRGLLLHMVSQWPYTLPAFHALHGELSAPVEQFIMRLSPISIGATMIPDAAPHLISMLQALAGPGDCDNIVVSPGRQSDSPELGRLSLDSLALDFLTLDFTYRTPSAAIKAQLQLQTCVQRPRPAWYQINDMRVEREVVLPEYQQYLVANGRRVALSDPMEMMAVGFLAALRSADRGRGTFPQGPSGNPGQYFPSGGTEALPLLLSGHNNLLQLAAALPPRLVV